MAEGTDALLTQLGTGTWSLLHILSLIYSSIPIVPHAMGSAFLAPDVAFSCRPPALALHHHNSTTTNFPTTTTITSTTASTITASTLLPADVSDVNTHNDECTYKISGEEERWREERNETSEGGGGGGGRRRGGEEEKERLEKCTEWDFDNSTFTSTVTSEFQLVCERGYLRTTYQSIYMFGVFVGSPINGFLSDRYGRKTVIVVGTCLYLVIAPGSTWLPQFPSLLLSRFLLGFLHAVISFTSFILAMELAEPRYRTAVGFLALLGWAFGLMVYGVMAYFVRSWRLLQLVGSLPILIFLPLLWVMDESPRWLVVTGRHEKALKVLRRAARWHKVTLPSDHDLLRLADQTPSEVTGTEGKRTVSASLRNTMEKVFVLYRTPRLRTITLLLYVNYLVAAMVYYGVSLSGGSLTDSPFVYMVLSGLVEVPAYTLLIPVVQRVGRRIPASISFLFCGTALVALAFIPKGYNWLVVLLAMLGKVAITSAFQIVVFLSSELFPTEVRGQGVGTSFMMSRVGSIISPVIIDKVGYRHAWAPSVVFGAASFLAAASTLLLPETLGTALPDTIADLERRQTSTKRPSWLRSLVTRNKGHEECAAATDKEVYHTPE